jgi:AMP deaminase
MEYRISIYGKAKSEWEKLAKWFSTYEICSSKIAWMIQVPRIYGVFKKAGIIQNFQDMLANIFEPVM